MNIMRPANLEQAEMLFNTERIYKRPRTGPRRVTPVDVTPTRCHECDKVGFRSEAAARIIISKMLYNGTLQGPDSYTFRPYLCRRGWWHTGHDPNSRRIFTNLLRKTKVVLH